MRDVDPPRREERSGTGRTPSLAREFGLGLVLSLAVHAAALAFVPGFVVEELPHVVTDFDAVQLADDLPPPFVPLGVASPALPEPPELELTVEDATVEDPGAGRGDHGLHVPDVLPRPPEFLRDSLGSPFFVPHRVAPQRGKLSLSFDELSTFYPEGYADAGIEGVVDLWLFVNRRGRVQTTRLESSSGHPDLDEAASRVAKRLEYLPAMDREKPVGVWIQLRVCFVVTDSGRIRMPTGQSCASLVRG